MTKKKPAKAPDKPKKKEQPNKQKPKGKKTPSRIYKSTKPTSVELDAQMGRAADRINAVVRASNILVQLGYPNDRGNSLVIVPRLKLMLAFDSQDMHESLQKNADISSYKLIHILPAVFKQKSDLTTFLKDAVDVHKDEEVKPRKRMRLKKLSKPLDRNLGKI